MESTMSVDSGPYPESPMDQDDIIYPCKGCGEVLYENDEVASPSADTVTQILEEGKAFELAGNRWHIHCFRCNTCGTALDSDANLLLLGDGSLICNNCTYSCNACGNKIEDLAILTGDQAFCASCFRCRNCKRKIENLRYARTSQGIFCMSCHESLMARRRKKGKTSSRQAQGGAAGDKALPSLPPGAAAAFSPDMELTPSEGYSESIGPLSPEEKSLRARTDASPNPQRDASPLSDGAFRGGYTMRSVAETADNSSHHWHNADGPTLPASTYGDRRPSHVSDMTADGDERGFLPMAFDPTPVAPKPPQASVPPRKQLPGSNDSPTTSLNDGRPPKDYFGRSAKQPIRDVLRDDRQASSSRSASTEREIERNNRQPKTSPHILFQEKGRPSKRETSNGGTPLAGSPSVNSYQERSRERPAPPKLETSSATSSGEFKLGDVPKQRKSGSRKNSRTGQSPILPIPSNVLTAQDRIDRNASPMSMESPSSGINPFDDPKRKENPPTSGAHPPPRNADRPARGDSLAPSSMKGRSPTPDSSAPTTAPSMASTQLKSSHNRQDSTSSFPASLNEAAQNNSPWPQPQRGSFDAPPPRASSRVSAPSKSVANGDFIAPRPAPAPSDKPHKRNESVNTVRSMDARQDQPHTPGMKSATLPPHSSDGAFSMEEEMARILRGEKKDAQGGDGPSVLRRVSNAVKHGRSFSERGVTSTGKTPPRNMSVDISAPITRDLNPGITSPTSTSALDQLRSQLRRANQRIAELEAEKNGLEDKVNNSADITAASNELNEKRNTMVVLDTQREMIVAELESMTAHLKRAKDSNQPLDLPALKSDILKDFTESLRKVKENMGSQIEDLMRRRNELTDEIGNLIQMKDKGFAEFESVSAKNAQLVDMNNQLVSQIQDMYKANRMPNGSAGLGIYQSNSKAENLNVLSANSSQPDLVRDGEAEPATIIAGPQVVNIRKGQPKKFNWRKGGEKMAKNVTKGLKGAFVGDKPPSRDVQSPYSDIGMPYSATTPQALPGSELNSLNSSRQGAPPGSATAPGFGLFGQKNGGLKPGGLTNMKDGGSSTNVSAVVDPSVLFGSELEARCEFEKRVIPSMVTHCVDEVELRGMDVEGIYRKSGGSLQVKSVQQGFEKDGDHDISDQELDIHAVTSALKQYFRRLPTPLITHDVYDALLDAAQITDKEKQTVGLRRAVDSLPEHHRNCLEYLIQHLARVMSHESINLMTPLNLAVVFAPTIMRPLSIEREMSDMQAQRTAVQAMLEQHEAIFSSDE